MKEIKKLNILMCCHLPLRSTLGGAKVYMEAAEFYKKLGHNVVLLGVDELTGSDAPFMNEQWRVQHFPTILKKFILNHHYKYDVVEFESLYLPFDLKKEVSCLLVARSVLLDLHFREITIPRFSGFRSLIGLLLKKFARTKALNLKIEQSLSTMRAAHFVNVPNPDDKKILERFGISSQKIIVQPYGIFCERAEAFKKISSAFKRARKIAFVGTFDNRKGAVEFPQIISALAKKYPDVQFKLLGVLGMFPTEESIKNYLGKECSSHVEIISRYSPDELPSHLADCLLGVFPSYLESFGFGVLEMMAMDLPVAAYDCPGVNMLVPPDLQRPRGDAKGLAQVLDKLLADEEFRAAMTLKCREKVSQFTYENEKNQAAEIYQENLRRGE